MACLLGFSILMPKPDLIKFEFGVRGLFRSDLVIGNDASRKFVLVEFEGGQRNSIFRGGAQPITDIGHGRLSMVSGRLSIGAGQNTIILTTPFLQTPSAGVSWTTAMS